ncbi:MAG TPA: hypothetical protein VHE35_18685, partial [Kofleriaceae bacterium]|nr:hypothetical protein [Kofleriaceae bacterium]
LADAADDAAVADAPAIDARALDAAVIDAPVDAAVDAATDAPTDACEPTWNDLLVNPAFDTGVAPWTQSSTIIRTAAQMPFAPQSPPSAVEFGVTNNADDVLTQTVTIPADATALRLRGWHCDVTTDLTAGSDTFVVTLETPGGAVLETLHDISNANVGMVCAWETFEWDALLPHAGETLVLRFHGRTNAGFLTRFVVDSLALEALACP